jgi:hypothetical protein
MEQLQLFILCNDMCVFYRVFFVTSDWALCRVDDIIAV